jgi:hypothetical protein
MNFRVRHANDPTLDRTHATILIAGPSASGKTSLLAKTLTSGIICDVDGTIGRYRHQLPPEILVEAGTTYASLLAILDAIARRKLTPTVLAIDGFSTIINELDISLGPTTPNSVFYRLRTEALLSLIRRLLSLPCHIVLTARRKLEYARAFQNLSGYVVAPGESIVLDETADIPEALESYIDTIILLQRGGEGYRAAVRKSILQTIPQSTRFSEPLAEIPPLLRTIFYTGERTSGTDVESLKDKFRTLVNLGATTHQNLRDYLVAEGLRKTVREPNGLAACARHIDERIAAARSRAPKQNGDAIAVDKLESPASVNGVGVASVESAGV